MTIMVIFSFFFSIYKGYHTNNLGHVYWHLAMVIQQIIQLYNSLDSMSFMHIPREWNGVVDCLAKWAFEHGLTWNIIDHRVLPFDLSQMLVQLVDQDKAM